MPKRPVIEVHESGRRRVRTIGGVLDGNVRAGIVRGGKDEESAAEYLVCAREFGFVLRWNVFDGKAVGMLARANRWGSVVDTEETRNRTCGAWRSSMYSGDAVCARSMKESCKACIIEYVFAPASGTSGITVD